MVGAYQIIPVHVEPDQCWPCVPGRHQDDPFSVSSVTTHTLEGNGNVHDHELQASGLRGGLRSGVAARHGDDDDDVSVSCVGWRREEVGETTEGGCNPESENRKLWSFLNCFFVLPVRRRQ